MPLGWVLSLMRKAALLFSLCLLPALTAAQPVPNMPMDTLLPALTAAQPVPNMPMDVLLPDLTAAQPVPNIFTDTTSTDILPMDNAPISQWIYPVCFSAIFLGCAYLLWTIFRKVRWPRLCHLMGALTLAMSIVWTVIDRTVSTEDNLRYPVLSVWVMFVIAFVSESSVGIPGYILYIWTILGFALILVLTSFAVDVAVSLQSIPTWMASHRRDVPIFFSLWALAVSTLFHLPSRVQRWMSGDLEMDEIDPLPNSAERDEAGDMADGPDGF